MARLSQSPAETGRVFSRIGNLGCIRFPPPIRKISGIKRDDRLIVQVIAKGTISVRKIGIDTPAADSSAEQLSVKKCECEVKPDGCDELVTVGWSYIQLSEPLAKRLGFLQNRPIELTAVAEFITIRLRRDAGQMRSVEPVKCPP